MTGQSKYVNKLKGSRVLIFGGTSGLGYGVAEAVLEYGVSKLIISSSRESRVKETIAKLKKNYPSTSAEIIGYECNLGDQSNLESNIKDLFSKVGTLDHIVSTAGDSVATMPLKDIDLSKMIQGGMVRFFAPMLIAKYAPEVLAPGPASSIVLTTGAVSQHPMPDWSVVGAFASGLHGMTRGLALDLKPIRVNLISPGGVDTEMWDHLPAEQKEGLVQHFAQGSATGRVGQVPDVVEAFLYCMRDHNLTATMISSNGGSLIM